MARDVVDRDLGFKKIIKDLENSAKFSVRIGIQEGAKVVPQQIGERKSEAGASVAQYAAYNEFGTRTIPERSFMRTAFDENLTRIESIVSYQYNLTLEGQQTFQQTLGIIGQVIVGMIQRKIGQIHSPPNAPSTIEKKGSSKPLIDFGQMIKSVTYVVRKDR